MFTAFAGIFSSLPYACYFIQHNFYHVKDVRLMATQSASTSNNPAFAHSAFGGTSASPVRIAPPSPTTSGTVDELNTLYAAPPASADQAGRMTVEDTIAKAGLGFFLVLVGAAIGWMIPALAMPAALIGMGLAFANIFKKIPSPALVLSYAAAQGIFLGGLSMFYETQYPGIVSQAVIATLAVAGTTLALFVSGKVRASARATKIFLIAIVGYLVYSLLNMILMMTGVVQGAFGLDSMPIGPSGIKLGFVVGILVILLAAYSLVLDFEMIKKGVEQQAPQIFGWRAAFGLLLTLIWLYLQVLRLLAIMRN